MNINLKELATLQREAGELSLRPLSKAEERRFTFLLSAISAVKAGASLQDVMENDLNERERANGFKETKLERNTEARGWQKFVNAELRDEVGGNPISRIGTYTGIGSFVPTEFITDVVSAQATSDALMDEDAVTFLKTTNGRSTAIPTIGDIENVATIVGESSDQSGNTTNIHSPGQAVSGVYSFRSPLWRIAMEAFQDITAAGDAMKLFAAFAADRIARGAGTYLVNGTGINQPLGLVPALAAAGVVPTIATGSSINTGGSETGANSIGSQDIAKLYLSVNEAYRNSPKAAWFMSDTTRAYLASIVTKYGAPLVNWQADEAYIFGKPIRVSPSMPQIGASNTPIVFGDGSYWLTRQVLDDSTFVQLFRELPGLAERGEVGLRMFTRIGGTLLYNDINSPAPFGVLQNHS